MRRFGNLLMALGAMVGVFDIVAMSIGLGVDGVSWIVAVGFMKFTLVAAAGMMAAGAASVRIARTREMRRLESTPEANLE